MKQIVIGVSNHTKQSIANQEPTPEQYKKYYICKNCEFATSSVFFSVISDKHLSAIQGKKCKKCGCCLSLKIRSNSPCPENKW